MLSYWDILPPDIKSYIIQIVKLDDIFKKKK